MRTDIQDTPSYGKRIRIFFDKENQLLGLQPSPTGYKITEYGRLRCRVLPEGLPKGKFLVKWNIEQEMFIAKVDEPL